MKKKTSLKHRGIPRAEKVYSIHISIEHSDWYDRDFFTARQSTIKKLVKENPVLQRLIDGENNL